MLPTTRIVFISYLLRLLVFLLVCLPLIAAAITYPSNRRIFDRQNDASTNYVETAGRVLKSELVETHHHTVVVDYEYQVNGQTYRSDRYAYTHNMKAFIPWEEALKIFSEGSPVRVFYNPQHPEESVLNSAPPNTSAMLSALAFDFFSLICGVLVMASTDFRAGIYKAARHISKNIDELQQETRERTHDC